MNIAKREVSKRLLTEETFINVFCHQLTTCQKMEESENVDLV